MKNYTFQGLYGFPTPITPLMLPILSTRNPTSTDNKYIVGQEWINTVASNVWILTSKTATSATWVQSAAGTGFLSTLTTDDMTVVVPTNANINLAGAAGQLATTGSGSTATIGFANPSTTPGAFTVTGLLTGDAGISVTGGAVTLNSGTNAVYISTDAAATTVDIGTGGAAKTVVLGSTTTTSSTTIQGGTGGIVIAPTAGDISLAPATTSSASASVTLNDRLSCITFTGFTTAMGGKQAFTITNSNILTTSAILCTVANLNASTNGAIMGVQGLVQATGSVVVETINNGAGALGSGDNVLLTLWILS